MDPVQQVGSGTSSENNDVIGFVSGLSRTLAAANGFILDQLRHCGLRGIVTSHGDILMKLFADGPTTMQELASAIGRDPSTVTSLVKKLAAGGFVETRKSTDDRRATEVHLTATGRALEGDFKTISEALQAVQMKGVDPSDFTITCRVLRQIRNNFVEAREQENR